MNVTVDTKIRFNSFWLS